MTASVKGISSAPINQTTRGRTVSGIKGLFTVYLLVRGIKEYGKPRTLCPLVPS